MARLSRPNALQAQPDDQPDRGHRRRDQAGFVRLAGRLPHRPSIAAETGPTGAESALITAGLRRGHPGAPHQHGDHHKQHAHVRPEQQIGAQRHKIDVPVRGLHEPRRGVRVVRRRRRARSSGTAIRGRRCRRRRSTSAWSSTTSPAAVPARPRPTTAARVSRRGSWIRCGMSSTSPPAASTRPTTVSSTGLGPARLTRIQVSPPTSVIAPSSQRTSRSPGAHQALERGPDGGVRRFGGRPPSHEYARLAQAAARPLGHVALLADEQPGERGTYHGRVTEPRKRVLLAKPRGYCAGVDRAVQTVEEALKLYGAPVYVRKQIVHNKHVVNTLEALGAIFVEENEEVPEGATVVFSAHGVAPEVHEQAKAAQPQGDRRDLPAGHQGAPRGEAVRRRRLRHPAHRPRGPRGGHRHRPARRPTHIQLVDGPDAVDNVVVRDPAKVVWLSQTTLSVDETMETVARLKTRLPLLQSPPSDDICYATQNRQHVVKEIAPDCDVVIVVGSKNSSNSVRLVEVAVDAGAAGRLPGRLRLRDPATSGWPAPPRSASRPAPASPRTWSWRCSRTWPSAVSARSPSTPPPRSGSPSRCRRSCAAT